MTGDHEKHDKDTWDRIQSVFDAALDLEDDARRGFLEETFAHEPALREPVERLLAAAEGAGPLDHSLPDLASTLARAAGDEIGSLRGRRIGPWRLGPVLGTGGMGRVHYAERVDGGFEQTAALKVLRWDMADADLIARFENERQILADLEHPNIARLIDGGVTEDGLPYLAMEYVDGVPIDGAIEYPNMGLRERLELFLDVAAAVQHAHERLIVHRDLKPSNILVTGDGKVRLLDFGVAKILDATSDAGATQTHAAMATPLYAAPEQLQGGRITTATDVWALGVLLYRLLCDNTPFGHDRSELTQLIRAILEDDPLAPTAVRPELDRDLETIVLKALEKDPARRYGTAERVAADVRRYLEGRPIEARPATVGYRTRKYVRRHRRGLAVVAAAVVVIAGTVGFYTQRLADERDRVQREASRTEAVKDFLVSLFEVNDPTEARGEDLTARDMLDRGAERIPTELADQPAIRAELDAVVGGLYQELGRYEDAQTHFERAIEGMRAVHGPEAVEVGDVLGRLGYALQELGEYEAAERTMRESLRIQRTHPDHPVDRAAAANQLGMLLSYKGDYAASEELLREAEETYAEALGPGDPRRATALSNLGLTIKWSGRMDEAEPIYREALRIRREALGDQHTDVAVTLDNLGVLLGQRGDFDESEACFREALAIRRALLGDEHPDVALNLNNLATLFRVQGRLDDAEPIYRDVLERNRRALGEDHPRVATNLVNLGSVQLSRGDAIAATQRFERALEIRRAVFDDEHAEVANALGHLVDAHLAADRVEDARAASAEALRVARATVAPESHRLASALHVHAEVLLRLGRAEEARRHATEALAIRETVLAPDHPETVATRDLIAACDDAAGAGADG